MEEAWGGPTRQRHRLQIAADKENVPFAREQNALLDSSSYCLQTPPIQIAQIVRPCIEEEVLLLAMASFPCVIIVMFDRKSRLKPTAIRVMFGKGSVLWQRCVNRIWLLTTNWTFAVPRTSAQRRRSSPTG